MEAADLSYDNAIDLLASVSSKLVHSRTALQVLEEKSQRSCFLSTGMKSLDYFLQGGLIIGTISEVCGPPGIGKISLRYTIYYRADLMACRQNPVLYGLLCLRAYQG